MIQTSSLPESWYDLPLAVFDLETTGFDFVTCEIIEVGIVQFYRGEVQKVYNWLIDPECQIPENITELTHITQADVTGQPKFREVAPLILAAFADRGIVAYNSSFDCPFLTYKLRNIGLDWPSSNPILDPLVFAQHLWPNQKNKLGMVAERLGVSLVDAHRACNDAEATGKVLYAMRDQLPTALKELLVCQAEWSRAHSRFGRDNHLLVAQCSSVNNLSTSFLDGDEPDPLRSIYASVPMMRREISR